MSKSDPTADALMNVVFKSKPLVPSTVDERIEGPGSYVIPADGPEDADEETAQPAKRPPPGPTVENGEVVAEAPVTYATAKKSSKPLNGAARQAPSVTRAKIVAATVDGDPTALLATSVLRQIECAADSLAFFGRNPKIDVLVGDLRGILGEASEALGEILQESNRQTDQT